MAFFSARRTSWNTKACVFLLAKFKLIFSYITIFFILSWIKNEYNNPELYITENGWSDDDGETVDIGRINYMRDHLNAVLQAIHEDGCNVKGYTVWSIMDNFEWLAGYTYVLI